ncbi:uncharacterized protein [Epargyreus clarus]|uniref:uncharacterized protein n=1 Tax=Epargyreus clarus TaxID=520877 RepID=UPI003C2E2B45
MIAYKGREVKRGRKTQMARNIERLYKEAKCRDCSVIVTRMDFAKILGKFTKVKIQYENVTSPKTKKVIAEVVSPVNDSSRLKTNENGMVLFRRNAYNKHPINNSQIASKKPRLSETSSPRLTSNVLKENNGLNKSAVLRDRNSNYNTKHIHSNAKQYAIVFVDPKSNNNKDCNNQILLAELVPKIDQSLLPSEDWSIDYLPKAELRDDKVYDRIEAELEGLMFSEKPEEKTVKQKPEETKVDEFPSIMDILNDNYSVTESKQNDQNVILEFKSNLESTDVEAMLLGKSSGIVKISESTPMEVDSNVMSKLIEDVEKISTVASVEKDGDKSEPIVQLSITENPQSPSILDETLQKGVEEYIPAVSVTQTDVLNEDTTRTTEEEGNKDSEKNDTKDIPMEIKINVGPIDTMSEVSSDSKTIDMKLPNPDIITHILFKKLTDGKCTKIVTCPKNLKYSIEIEGKPVEFLGAPKYISSVEDLKVLLQIVNESGLDSLYVLH